MPKKINLKKILKSNPRVDEKKLAEGHELLEKLRMLGVRKRGYRLALPYSRRRAQVSPKPYTIYLQRP
jgi:hypothetical protein